MDGLEGLEADWLPSPPAGKSAETVGDEDYQAAGDDDAPAPAKKSKRSKASKALPVRAGPLVLERFKTMPLDILSEVRAALRSSFAP